MGLGGFSTGGNATFLRIGMGKDDKGGDRAIIGRRAQEGDPGAVQVMFKDEPVIVDGKPVYRTEHAFIEGNVVAIERTQPEFNGKKVDMLVIRIDSGGEQYALQIPKGDDYWLDLACRCPNVDWSKSVKLQPYSIPQEDSKYSNRFLVIYQDGGKVEKAHKVKWMREVPDDYVQDAAQPPPFTYDADESAWRKGKTLRWLDEGPIQKAIDKVKFLNEQPEQKTALDAAAEHAQRKAEPDPFALPKEEEDDELPW